MSSSNTSEIDDQLNMAFQGVMEEAMSMLQAKKLRLPPLLHQHEGQSVIDDTSIVTMNRLISDYDTTTLTMIVCTLILLPSEVSYTNDSFSKHYA
jgi:hypothetical protein